MISVMADIICASDYFDDDRLNEPDVWQQFMQAVLDHMEDHPSQAVRLMLDTIDREQFQSWIDDPRFWGELNDELDRRAQVLMTLLPSQCQGNC